MSLGVAIVAPFSRDRASGGSQRATTVAETLEDAGCTVSWTAVESRTTTPRQKLAALAKRVPSLSADFPDDLPTPRDADVLLVAHSYLPCRLQPTDTPLVVDFHNLEHEHLEAVARTASGARAPWLKVQARLMHREERRLLEQHPALMVAPGERDRARALAPGSDPVLFPNLLPRDERARAQRIAAHREPGDRLLYVGTVGYVPNQEALTRFLRDDWPGIRAANPGVELDVVGRAPDDVLQAVERHDGVTVHGFVEDLAPLATRAAAAVLPFDGAGGTSLRVLFWAVAGVPLLAPAAGLRGLDVAAPGAVTDQRGWAEATRAARDHALDPAETQRQVEHLHDDPAVRAAVVQLVGAQAPGRVQEAAPQAWKRQVT